MEINQYSWGIQPHGALATEDIVEGRFVLLTSHTWDEGFGSLVDLPGVKLPDTDAEAQLARYCITWAAPERNFGGQGLWLLPETSYQYDFSMRQGFGAAANTPLTNMTVRTVYPGNQESQTIPSGQKVRLLGPDAVVTLPSGQFVYNVNLRTPGSRLEVLNSADDGADHGKLGYAAAGTIAEVYEFNTTTAAITVRLLG